MTTHKMVQETTHYVDDVLHYRVVKTTVDADTTRTVVEDHYDYSTNPTTHSATASTTTRTQDEGASAGPNVHAVNRDESAEEETPTLTEAFESLFDALDKSMTTFAVKTDKFFKDFTTEYKKVKAEAEKARNETTK